MESKRSNPPASQFSAPPYQTDSLDSEDLNTAASRGMSVRSTRGAKRVDSDDDYDRRVAEHKAILLSPGTSRAETKSSRGDFGSSKKESRLEDVGYKQSRNFAEEKQKLVEIQQDIEADEEFERLKSAPTVVAPSIGQSTFAQRFVKGFRILSMNMRDATSGRLIWRSASWNIDEMFDKEIREEIPKEILRCRVVSREIIFTSREEMNNFRLEQRVYFKGVCIEQWFFAFGYVMAGSRNSWQQTIDAAPPSEMLPAEVLSGQVVFETAFYDDKEFLCKNSVRIYYV